MGMTLGYDMEHHKGRVGIVGSKKTPLANGAFCYNNKAMRVFVG